MKGKIAFVLGAAVGYVLGSRAGRERYEQIKAGAERVWHTAPVQRGVDALQGRVDDGVDALKAYGIDLGGKLFANLANRTAADTTSATKNAPAPEGKPANKPANKQAGATAAAPQKKPASKPAVHRSASAGSSASKSSNEDEA